MGEKVKVVRVIPARGEVTINVTEGQKQKVVLESEASRQKQINKLTGQAEAIRAVLNAKADGQMAGAASLKAGGGMEAVQLRLADKLVEQFGNLAKQGNTLILTGNFGDMSSIIATAMSIVKQAG